MRTPIFVLELSFLLPFAAHAQLPGADSAGVFGSGKRISVRGQITSENSHVGFLSVSLAGTTGMEQSVVTSFDGSFEFRSVEPGVYELQVLGTAGYVIHREEVSISGPIAYLSVKLSDRSKTTQATVSFRELVHKVPKQAQKEFTNGKKAAIKGNTQMAMDHFEKALAIDPEFADAYNEVGAIHATRESWPEAAKQFQKAVDLVPEHQRALPNLAIALYHMKQYDECAEAARRSLKVDPTRAGMHYLLALSVLTANGSAAEALDHLQRAADQIPKARLFAASLLVRSGRRGDAAQQLKAYLNAVPQQDADRPKVEALLSRLQQ